MKQFKPTLESQFERCSDAIAKRKKSKCEDKLQKMRRRAEMQARFDSANEDDIQAKQERLTNTKEDPKQHEKICETPGNIESNLKDDPKEGLEQFHSFEQGDSSDNWFETVETQGSGSAIDAVETVQEDTNNVVGNIAVDDE